MANIYPLTYLRDKFVPFNNANLSIASSPVLYGLSTYTVIPLFKSANQLNIFRYEDHYKRLVNSASILSLDDFAKDWPEARLKTLLTELVKKNDIKADSLIRINVFVDGILTGTKMMDVPHSISIFIYDMQPILPASGAKIKVSSWRRVSDNAIPARAKASGSYVNASLMKNEALKGGYDDAVALDDHGHVSESSVSNIFIVRQEQLITPSIHNDLLEGITRDTIFKLAQDIGVPYKEATIDRTELYIADEAFLSGSSVSITPVINIDGHNIADGQVGKITKLLIDKYTKISHSKLPDKHHWLTKI